jgi:hypothetical protein
MTDVLLLIIVVGVIVVALGVDLAAGSRGCGGALRISKILEGEPLSDGCQRCTKRKPIPSSPSRTERLRDSGDVLV